MNPFDWSGGPFLALFGGLMLAGLAVHLIVRRRAFAGADPAAGPELTPYELAHLRSGARGVTLVALADLLERGVLAWDGAGKRLEVRSGAAADRVEEAIVSAAPGAQGPAAAMRAARPACAEIERVLVRRGLVPSEAARTRVRRSALLLGAVLLVVAGVKVAVGVSRDRPVGFLVLLSLAVVVAGVVSVRTPRSTRSARRLANVVSARHRALRTTMSSAPQMLTPLLRRRRWLRRMRRGRVSTRLVGLGLGWRPAMAHLVDVRDDLGFVEVMAEQVDPRALPAAPRDLRDGGMPIAVHSVSMSLAEAAPLRRRAVEHAARVADALRAEVVSDHIALIGAGDIDAGHLLPPSRTRATVDVVAEHATEASRILGRPLALENPAALFVWPEDEMGEAAFLTAIVAASGASIVLDASNLAANGRNGTGGAEPPALPLDAVAYMHVGGGVERDGVVHDTHAHRVLDASLRTLRDLRGAGLRAGVMLERDDRFIAAEISADIDALRAVTAA